MCVGDSDSTYDPPLTLQPRETRVHAEARYTCGIGPGRTVAATGTLDGVSPAASCVTLAGGSHVAETVRYADGERSEIAYTHGATGRAAGLLTLRLSGHVTAGRGKGQEAHRTVAALPGQLPTQCLTSGLTGSHGRAQLEIRP
ncbi:hypothetical protein M1P56_27400 [Streptomyces sp. HU2014]|uniref:Uncharacterized protein n=1 Tax=Streptomyces albireticuli TaxID=1940 RepID=A0A1Z2L0H0_9ACTN|nr:MULTISPECIES: hypothetical protein [Streptomyces]ARZ67797.1 hypothetical protein SMD11_2145 [Streptomyces albireticuli]UQI47796.1 hypothetical protein M1P56_27400 [Streptomyces sp. HU2014]